jgi:hypothetical protein
VDVRQPQCEHQHLQHLGIFQRGVSEVLPLQFAKFLQELTHSFDEGLLCKTWRYLLIYQTRADQCPVALGQVDQGGNYFPVIQAAVAA